MVGFNQGTPLSLQYMAKWIWNFASCSWRKVSRFRISCVLAAKHSGKGAHSGDHVRQTGHRTSPE